MTRPLSDAAMAAFQRRGIGAETVARLEVFSCRRAADGAMVPDAAGNVVAFPYFDHGAQVACKYRAPQKKFWQDAGGKRTFFNADIMDDPALANGSQALVIVEGEIDCLSVISSGFPFCVSVPDGAPSVPAGKEPDELDPLDPTTDPAGKFEFLYNNRDRLKRIKRFVIAVDSDAPGKRLAAELVRRLGASQCSFVEYPEDCIVESEGERRRCKDLNDVLMNFGQEGVARVLNGAKPYPVRGLYKLSEYPSHEALETFATGFEQWGPYLRIFPGEFMVVTGVPTHGKSSWVSNLLFNLAAIHGWRSAIFSPEMPAVPILRDRFRRLFLRRKPQPEERTEIARADAWIERQFIFIDADPTGDGDNDEPFDLEWIIDRARDAVLRDGVRVLVIDPWNEVEHARERGESMTDYIARGIRALKRFARAYGVAVIVVAHPTKDVFKEGKQRTASLYDIEGAAHWNNKADHGIVIERPTWNGTESIAHILKVRFDETGRRAKMTMDFERETGMFNTVSVEAA